MNFFLKAVRLNSFKVTEGLSHPLVVALRTSQRLIAETPSIEVVGGISCGRERPHVVRPVQGLGDPMLPIT